MILNRILLVDDSPRDTELALEALAAHHLANEVVTLRDGVEALDYLYRRGEFAAREDDDPVVVLLDLKMPRVDGMEVLRQLKSDPAMKSIPVVMPWLIIWRIAPSIEPWLAAKRPSIT